MSNSGSYSSTPQGMTPEQAQKLGEQTYAENQKKLAADLKIQADEDGKYNVLGIEIPKTLAPALNIAIDTFVGPVSNAVADVVYKQTSSVVKSMTKSAERGHSVGLTAEIIARWGIIFANPISKFVNANASYGQELIKLHREMKSICEATGADYQHNHMVRAASQDVYNRYMERLTLVLPSLFSLVPQAMYGLQMQQQSRAKRDAQFIGGDETSGIVQNVIDKHLAKIDDVFSKTMKEREYHDKLFKDFKSTKRTELKKILDAKYGARDKDNKIKNQDYESNYDKYLLKYFDEEVWSTVLKEIKDNEAAARKGKPHAAAGASPESEATAMNMLLYYAPAASALGEGIKAAIADSQKKHGKKVTSLAMVYKLKEQLQGRQSVEWVQEEAVKIFQHMEEEMGHGNTAFSGPLLETLKERVRPIAQAIADGRVDALTLVKFAGEDLVVEHSAKGRNFKSLISIEQAVDDVASTQLVKGHEVSEKDFMGRFTANQEQVKEAVKHSLSTLGEGEVRDFFITIMPAEVLEHAGLKRDEIRDARKRAHGRMYDQVAASILHIAAMEEKLLHEHGVSSKEIDEIKQLSDQLIQGNREKLEKMIDRHDPLVAALAAEILSEQIGGNEQAWTDRVGEACSLEQRLAEIKQSKEKDTKKDAHPRDDAEAKDEPPMPQRTHAHHDEHAPHREREHHRRSSHAADEPSRHLGA